MPGVYRDPATGTYVYQSTNDYEDRRRRDMDDRLHGPPPPPPRPSWSPPPHPPWGTLPTTRMWLPTLAPAPPSWKSLAGAAPSSPLLTQWPTTPIPRWANAQEIQEFLALADRAAASGPPAQVGQNPAFDRLFDELTQRGDGITYNNIPGTPVMAPAGTIWTDAKLNGLSALNR